MIDILLRNKLLLNENCIKLVKSSRWNQELFILMNKNIFRKLQSLKSHPFFASLMLLIDTWIWMVGELVHVAIDTSISEKP